MIALPILVNSVDQSITVDLRDVNGSPMTGKVYNSSGFTCYYRQGATGAMTQLTLATQTVTGAHADGGFVELDATNAPGSYRLDLSDTMVDALGITEVFLNGIAGMDPLRIQVPIVAYNPQDAVRMGMTALPNAADGAAGGLSTLLNTIDDLLDTEIAAIKAKTDNLPANPADQSAVEAAITAAQMTAAGIRAAIGMAAANLDTQLAALAGYIDTEVAAIFNRIGAPVGASISSDIAAVNALVTATAIRAALGLATANMDTQLGDLPTNAELATALAAADDAVLAAIAALQTYVDTEVAAIKTKTDQLVFTVPNQVDANALTGGGGGGGGGATAEEIWTYVSRTLSTLGVVEYAGPISLAGKLTIHRRYAYKLAYGSAIQRSSDGWPDLTGSTPRLVMGNYLVEGTFAVNGDTQTLTFEIDDSVTATYNDLSITEYAMYARFSGPDDVLLATGILEIV